MTDLPTTEVPILAGAPATRPAADDGSAREPAADGVSAHDPAGATPAARVPGGHPLTGRLTGPLLAGLLGLAISLLFIGTPSIWYDEAATVTATTRSYPELWRMLGNVDAVHGLYYLGMHVLFDVVGYSPVALRVPSAIAVGLTAALTVVLARLFLRPGAALLAGIVFALLPRTTWMGIEGRSYAMTALAAVVLTIVLVRAGRSASRRWWVLYSALAVVSCLLFLYVALIVVAHGASLAWSALAGRRRGTARLAPPATDGGAVPRSSATASTAVVAGARPPAAPSSATALRRWLLSAVVAAALLVPFALDVVGQSGQLHWIDPLNDTTLRQVLQTQWFQVSAEFAIAGWPLIAFGLVVLAVRDRALVRLVLPLLVLPTVILLVATAVYTPLYTPRYLAMCLPLVAVAIAAAVTALPTRLIASLVTASLVVLAVPAITAQRQPAAKENTDWSHVADVIAAQRADDGAASTTAMIYGWVRRHPSATSRVIAYSYPEAFAGTVDVTLDVPAAETGRLWETRAPLASRLDRVQQADAAYLVTSIKRDLRPQTTETLASIGWEPTDEWNIADVNIVRYAPAGAPLG
jgi:mannosyltransferase